MTFINIILINSGAIHINELFYGESEEKCKAKAERRFLEMCREYDKHFNSLTQEDIDGILDDGFYESHNGTIDISIIWPDCTDTDTSY